MSTSPLSVFSDVYFAVGVHG